MGMTAQFEHPDFMAAMAKILKRALARGVPCGLHVVAPSAEQLNQRIAEGYRFLAYSIDSVMFNQATIRPMTA
jgi:2-dehydro-3-deoxyglucarate aldolase